MTLVYRSELVELHHDDALELLGTMPARSVDLIVTDPPYGIEWQSRRRAATFDELIGDVPTDRDLLRRAIGETVRIVGQNRHLYVFGPADVLEGHKVSTVAELVWDKDRIGMGDVRSPWGPQHERISFTVSKHKHAGKAGQDVLPVRLRKGSVLRFPPPTGRNVRHPSEKPIGLLRELIESSSRAGEVVLDPFAGIGSTGVAAVLSGRRSILVEIDPGFVQIAEDRLRAAEELYTKAVRL